MAGKTFEPASQACRYQAIAEYRKKEHTLLVVVDNTFATFLFPETSKATWSRYSHAQHDQIPQWSQRCYWWRALVMNDKELYDKLSLLQNAVGAVPGPFDRFLVLRGIKILSIRMERHEQNAIKDRTVPGKSSKKSDVLFIQDSNHIRNMNSQENKCPDLVG